MIKKARVIVSTKRDVLDPAGVAVGKALSRNGLSGIEDLRIGKVIDISLRPNTKIEECLPILKKLASSILSNPVMEDFTIEIENESSDEK